MSKKKGVLNPEVEIVSGPEIGPEYFEAVERRHLATQILLKLAALPTPFGVDETDMLKSKVKLAFSYADEMALEAKKK